MLRLEEINIMNSTMHFMSNGNNNENMPFLWNKSDSKATRTSKRIGSGKFSRNNDLNTVSNLCNNDLADSNITAITSSPTPLREQSASSTPRRISFTKQDEGDDIHGLPLHNTEKRKTKKTFRFALQPSEATNVTIISQEGTARKSWKGTLTEEHCHELWYQKDDLAAIKREAKVIIANRTKIQSNPNASSEEQESLIGLERFSKQRAVWKKSAIQYVLMAQRQIRGLHTQTSKNNTSISKEDYIQSISLRCTDWARDAAKKQGFRDYCAVHDPLASLFSDSEFNNSETSLDDYTKGEEQNYNELIFGERTVGNASHKRKVGAVCDASNEQEQIDAGRRIRQRTALLQLV